VIVEIGSQDFNGSLRKKAPPGASYFGLDLEAGPGVDAVIAHGAPLPLATASVDLVVASSVFEHDPIFWVSFLELCRITKDGGFIYLNVPSNGKVHRYPVDCWRFYPDAANALTAWAVSSGVKLNLIESFTARQRANSWNDFVAVFERGSLTPRPPPSLLSTHFEGSNIFRFDSPEIGSPKNSTEDMRLLASAAQALITLAETAQATGRSDVPDADFEKLMASPKMKRLLRLAGRRAASSSGENEGVRANSLGSFEPLFRIVNAALSTPLPVREEK
jgi:SAM-dependent methyltransferase